MQVGRKDILLRTNQTAVESCFTFMFPEWVCQPHIHSNYTLWMHVEKIYIYIMAPCQEIHKCIACTQPLVGHMVPHYTVSTRS